MTNFLSFLNNLKFRKKLFISYFIVCIIPIIVLGSYSYYLANTFLQKQAKESIKTSIRQIARNINYRFIQYESVVNSIINNFKFQQIFSSNYEDYSKVYIDYVDPFFNNILYFYKDILQVSVLIDNPEIWRGEYIIPLKSIKDFSWYANAIDSKKTQWIGNSEKLFCTRLFPNSYVDNERENPSLLFISIDIDTLFKEINEIQLASYRVIIADSNREIVLSKSKNFKTNIDVSKVVFLNTDYSDIMINGREYMFEKIDIPEPGWEIFFLAPLSEISIDAREIISVTAVIIVICIMVLIIIIWLFSNTFFKRLYNLNKKMKIVEEGNLKIDVYSQSKDEIGELTNRFGRMLNNINILIDEVYHSKIMQKEAEMKALQTQINPHFLYNTLSIINWKALHINAMEICHIVNTISKFYRTVLNKGSNIILIKDEVENAKAYIEIQLIMHNYKFDFECDIDNELYKYNMINLVLQPILENALEHGIDRIRKGRGRLTLRGYTKDENIEFSIEDNGPGIPEELLNMILTQYSKGYGLKNVHERLIIFFGKQYGLKIHSELGRGTTVYLSIPKYIKQ